MIFPWVSRASSWVPATTREDGREVFSEDVVLALAKAHLRELAAEVRTGCTAGHLESVLQNPELRLGFELLPEIVAEHALRKIGTPRSFEYVLLDRRDRSHSFKVALHPIFGQVHHMAAHGLLPSEALHVIAKASSYADTVARALNSGEQLSNLSICVAPLGLRLHQGRLEIKGGE